MDILVILGAMFIGMLIGYFLGSAREYKNL